MALLLADGSVAENPWIAVDDEAETVPEGPVVISLERWTRDHASLAARNTPLGIRLKSDQLAARIAADLGRFALVALEFPIFRDGRAFSTARELRERYGFTGDIRAVGHVLPDSTSSWSAPASVRSRLPRGVIWPVGVTPWPRSPSPIRRR